MRSCALRSAAKMGVVPNFKELKKRARDDRNLYNGMNSSQVQLEVSMAPFQ